LELYATLGAKRVWLGPELSYKDLEAIAPTSPLPLSLTISGYQELMTSEHCVFMAEGPCDKNCASCKRRKTPRLLQDRKQYRFPVRTDELGRSHIYNAVALDLIGELPQLMALGVSEFVVDCTLLANAQIDEEVARAVRAKDLAVRGAGQLPKRDGHTTGHIFRGVL
jgi:putative protease